MSLPVFQATIVNSSGDIIPSAVVTVLDEITGLGLTIYSDRAGTVPLGTNGVFTAGTDGFAQFFAPTGNYRVKAEQAASGFEKTWNFVPLVGTGAFRDVQTSPTDTTAGRLMAVGAFGIGGNAINVSDADNAQGLTQLFGNSGLSKPNYPTVGIHAGLNIRGALDINSQFLITQTDTGGSNTDPEVFVRNTNISGGAFRPWKRIDPQAFGLGESNPTPYAGSADTLTTKAFYYMASAWVGSPYAGTNSNNQGYLEVSATNVSSYAGQTFKSLNNGAVFERLLVAGTWSAWQPVYTGANLNPNVFGGTSTDDYVAFGHAVTPSIAKFTLPVSGMLAPSSISLTDTFTVIDVNGATIAGGTYKSPALSAASSNKVAVIEVAGLSTTLNTPLILKQRVASSKITVNF